MVQIFPIWLVHPSIRKSRKGLSQVNLSGQLLFGKKKYLVQRWSNQDFLQALWLLKWKLYLYWVILGNHEYRKEIILVPKWGFKAAQQLSHRIPTVSPSLGDQNSISLQVLHWSRSGVYTSLLLRAWCYIPLGLQGICLLAVTWSWMVCSYLQIPNSKITVGLYFGNLADRSICTVKKMYQTVTSDFPFHDEKKKCKYMLKVLI